MEFGKFLFLYLLGRNVDYFAYKRILDLVLNDDDCNGNGNNAGGEESGGGDPSAPVREESAGSAGEALRRQISRPDVMDAAEGEITLPR